MALEWDELELETDPQPFGPEREPITAKRRVCTVCGKEIPNDDRAFRQGAVAVLNVLYARLLRAMTAREARDEVLKIEAEAGVDLI